MDASWWLASLCTGGVRPGDTVTGATVNTSGSLTIACDRVGAETTREMGELVASAQGDEAPIAPLADRVSAECLLPVILAISALTLVGWWLVSGIVDGAAAFNAAVSVLVVACPCAGFSGSTGTGQTSTGRGWQLGILIHAFGGCWGDEHG